MNVQDFTLNLKDDSVPYRLVAPTNAGKQWCVLWLQGWTSSMDSHLDGIKRLAEASNTTFCTMDYAGHGLHQQSIETSTRQQQINEVLAVFDELKKQGFDKIIVVGGSFGGYMAALLAGARPVRAVILRAPANYPDSELNTPYAQTTRHKDYLKQARAKSYLDSKSDNKALRAIKEFDGFVYVLEHELDEVVPKNLPQSYFEVAKHGNYLIVPSTKHSPKRMPNPGNHFKYIERLVASLILAIKSEL